MVTPNRIVLISPHGRHDEAPVDTDVWPGMFILRQADGNVIPHNVPGAGGGSGLSIFATENVYAQGGDITQKAAAASGNNVAMLHIPQKGDMMLALLQNLQIVAENVGLMSAGDGTLMANPGKVPVNIVAPSTVITNLGTETQFSNGSYAIPANFLQAGDIFKIHAKATCVAENSTNTHRVRMYIGSTTLADSAALQLVAADIVEFDVELTVRTIGASGTFVATFKGQDSVAGTFAILSGTVASTAIDTTVVETIAVKSLASATSAGNQIRLDEFKIEILRPTGLETVAVTDEACDNSGSTGTSGFNTAKFVRVWIP